MANPPANQPVHERVSARTLAPKPRSMQSQFILMEAAAVVVALLLMTAAVSVSFFIRWRLAYSVEQLQQRLSLQTQIHDIFDRALVEFWRTYRTPDTESLELERADTKRLQSSLEQFRQVSTVPDEMDQAELLEKLVDAHVQVSSQLLAGAAPDSEKAADERELRSTEAQITSAFTQISQSEFQRLWNANRRLRGFGEVLYVLIVILGLFPVAVMYWFRRAHERNIWQPIDQLYQMVLEVKRGNLSVKGNVPNTVEFGTLTSGFLAMASELSDMRDSLEEKVRLRAAQLEAANKDLVRAAKLAALGQLVAGVAHEINNPLTSILGFSEIVLSRPGLPPGLSSQLQTIRTEALRLKRLVANLSSFSRSKPQNFSRVDLRAIGDRLLQLRSYQLAANNIKIHYERCQQPVWVNADDEQLFEVLLSLVLNSEQAIRSVHEKGEIYLVCDQQSGWAILKVKDDGCGMSAEVRDSIFDPFFTTKPTGKGTGLGLSISHTIVDHHGGEITIDSAPGRGTTVRISLPLASEKEIAGGEEQVTAENSSFPASLLARQTEKGNGAAKKELAAPNFELVETPNNAQEVLTASTHPAARPVRILAIDDEPEILNLLSVALGKNGAQVVTLRDSSQLASVLNGEPFDIVLCDLKMPGQDGLAVLHALREKYPELAKRFILMTGNLADADKAELELEGMPILPKPFSLGHLREMLGQVLATNN
jgi:signal transduction histidine kinase